MPEPEKLSFERDNAAEPFLICMHLPSVSCSRAAQSAFPPTFILLTELGSAPLKGVLIWSCKRAALSMRPRGDLAAAMAAAVAAAVLLAFASPAQGPLSQAVGLLAEPPCMTPEQRLASVHHRSQA